MANYFQNKRLLEKIDRINVSNLFEIYDKVFNNPKLVVSMIGPEEKKNYQVFQYYKY